MNKCNTNYNNHYNFSVNNDIENNILLFHIGIRIHKNILFSIKYLICVTEKRYKLP